VERLQDALHASHADEHREHEKATDQPVTFRANPRGASHDRLDGAPSRCTLTGHFERPQEGVGPHTHPHCGRRKGAATGWSPEAEEFYLSDWIGAHREVPEFCECVADDAVPANRSPGKNFPANRENAGNFYRILDPRLCFGRATH
jgi:hypothetical protein